MRLAPAIPLLLLPLTLNAQTVRSRTRVVGKHVDKKEDPLFTSEDSLSMVATDTLNAAIIEKLSL